MKSVLISIKPEWCEMIANGKKTVEVRKTRPKLEAPFKCYIYCTKDFKPNTKYGYKMWAGRGKVIGEFVCDTFITDKTGGRDALFNAAACINELEAASYSQNKPLYGWHISDLVIYDKPKELSEFYKYCGDNPDCDSCGVYCYSNTEYGLEDYCCSKIEGCRPVNRPPQSWCYVEEVEE